MEQGRYMAYINDADKDVIVGDLSGTDCMFLTWTITDKIVGDNFESMNGEGEMKLFLTEKAMPYSYKQLKSLGFNDDFSNVKFNSDVYDAGNGVELENNPEPYNGKMYDNWIFPSGRNVKTTPENISKLNERLRALGGDVPQPQRRGNRRGGDDVPY